ncbi:SDR family oxidoreductase [Pseudonocardia adelaidensis]
MPTGSTSPPARRARARRHASGRAPPGGRPRQQRGHDRATRRRRTPDELWDRVIEVDLTAPFVLAREVGAAMIGSGRPGKIIFTASLLSFQGGVNVPGYTAAKTGLAGLTRALSNEWAASGICVNAIAPGYIATDNTKPLRDDRQRSRALLDRIPMGRFGEPDDLAGAAVFLASSAADYVTGIVPVDGGWLAR